MPRLATIGEFAIARRYVGTTTDDAYSQHKKVSAVFTGTYDYRTLLDSYGAGADGYDGTEASERRENAPWRPKGFAPLVHTPSSGTYSRDLRSVPTQLD